DVRTPDLAAVILDLLVGLEGLLRGQKVRTRKLESKIRNQKLRRRQRVVEAGTLRGITDQVVELQIAEAEAVRPGSHVPINARSLRRGVVAVGEDLEVIAEVGF